VDFDELVCCEGKWRGCSLVVFLYCLLLVLYGRFELVEEEVELVWVWGAAGLLGCVFCVLGFVCGDLDFFCVSLVVLDGLLWWFEYVCMFVEFGVVLCWVGCWCDLCELLCVGMEFVHVCGVVLFVVCVCEELFVIGVCLWCVV